MSEEMKEKKRVVGKSETPCSAWGALWNSHNNMDGLDNHLICRKGLPVIFKTRKAAKAWIDETHGYIRDRKDLRVEPHGWRMPTPVRITITPNAPAHPRRTGTKTERKAASA